MNDIIENLKERVRDYPSTITSEEIEYICQMYDSIDTKACNSIYGINIDPDLIRYNQEKIIKNKEELNELLKAICLSSSVGQWLLKIKGMTPYLSAMCISLFNVSGKEYALQFLNRIKEQVMAILNDSNPFNKKAKAIIEKIGNILSYNGDRYKNIFNERLAIENEKNKAGSYSDLAEHYIKNDNTSAADVFSFYSKGMLPPEHIRHKAKIWMEKVFVSHLFTEMYYSKYHKLPKKEREGGENIRYSEPEVPYIQ